MDKVFATCHLYCMYMQIQLQIYVYGNQEEINF